MARPRDDLDRAALAVLPDLIGDVGQESASRPVPAKNQRREPLDTGGLGPACEALDERRPDAAVLPQVRDGASELRLFWIIRRADVVGDADALPGRGGERHHRLVGRVVDVGELGKLAWRQPVDTLAEAAEA
jgi:hypothetical protein